MIGRLIAKRTTRGIEEVLGWMDKQREFNADQCLARSLCQAII